jgi:hypothetical protein
MLKGVHIGTLLIKLLHVPSFGDEPENRMALKSAIAAIRVKKKNPSWYPTIVLRVARDPDMLVARAMVTKLKELSYDLDLFRVVVELSDAHAAFALPDDLGRQTFLWVDDLTEAQAHQLLDDQGCLVPAYAAHPEDTNMTQRRRLFSIVGTRSLDLESGCDAVLEAGNLEQFLSFFQAKAVSDVDSLLNLKQPQAAPNSDGVAFRKLAELMIKNGGSAHKTEASAFLVPPDVACRVFKTYHAMYYHQPTFTYRFYTPAHRAAAEKLLLGSSLPRVQDPVLSQQPPQPPTQPPPLPPPQPPQPSEQRAKNEL